jgi:Uri superfamily endonuclease
MKSATGTYVLIFHNLSSKQVRIGKWGLINIQPGYYLYVGSAFGPGGLRARVARHYRTGKAQHWHIDYLREDMELVSVWYSYHHIKLEHDWARMLSAMPGMELIEGFGCSDCQCYSHLFRSVNQPEFKHFCNNAGGDILSTSF